MSSRVVEARLKRLLELRTDSPAMLEALDALASVSAESTSASGGGSSNTCGGTEARRRNLRSEVEGRNLRVITDFLARLSPMENRLEALEGAIGALSRACDGARARIEQSEVDTASFLSAADALGRKRDAAEAHLAEVTTFLTAYELRDDEADALLCGPAADDDGEAFFSALGRVSDIRGKSLGLITGRDQALGLELLEAATQQQSLALDRLFAWASDICRDAEQLAGGALADVEGGGSSSSSGTSAFDGSIDGDAAAAAHRRTSLFRALRRALGILFEHRPSYYRGCQDAVIASRRAAFVRRFVRALSSSGAATSSAGAAAAAPASSPSKAGASSGAADGGGGGFASIYLHAHDPLRYVTLTKLIILIFSA